MKIYNLRTSNSIPESYFYSTKNLARKALKKKRDEIIARGVNVTCDTEDKFSFYFGWEERSVYWRVSEITVMEE